MSKALPLKPNVKIGVAAKILGVSIDTLRRWEKKGKLQTVRTPGGTRLYNVKALQKIIGVPVKPQPSPSLPTSELLKKTTQKISPLQPVATEPVVWKNLPEPVTSEESWLHVFQPVTSEVVLRLRRISEVVRGRIPPLPIPPKNLLYMGGISFTVAAVATGLFLMYRPFLETAPKSKEAAVLSQVVDKDSLREVLAASNAVLAASNAVLAASASAGILEINTNVEIGGTLNGLTLIATSGSTLNVLLDVTLDQDVSTSSSPTFSSIILSNAINQIGGNTITFPSATTTLVGTDTKDTLTNKTMSGSSNTFTDIPNSALVNKKVTITAGTNLTGGGAVELGSSITISAKDSPSFSGQVLLSDGTASAPGLAFSSDTNSGLYRIGADNIALITGGTATQGISIDASGNVGLGTITPTTRLHVVGTGNITGAVTIGGTLGVTGATTLSSTLAINGNTTIGDASGDTITFNADAWTMSNDTNVTLSGGLNGLSFDTTTLSIDASNDRVGIGTTSPNYKLEVVGTSHFTGNSTFDGVLQLADGTNASPAYTFTNDTNTGLYRIDIDRMSFVTGGASRLSINSSGNVGIGTTDPATALEVIGAGTISDDLAVNGGDITTSATTFNLLNSTATTLNIGGAATSIIAGATNGAFDIRGNLGIGTSSPGARLSVAGGGLIGYTGTEVAPSNGLAILGNVGIGTTSPGYNLQVVGTANITGATTFGGVLQLSDGTVGSPSLTFTNDTDTGFYRVSPDTVRFTTGGVDRITINSSGNVGIGTTSPTTAFHVFGITTVSNKILAGAGSLDIGSSAIRFGTGYFDTVDATNLAGTVTGGSTSNASWTINSDNATNDAEDASLAFERGTGGDTVPNAVLGWDSSTHTATNGKEFDLNSRLHITGTIRSYSGILLEGFENDITAALNEHLAIMPQGTGNVGIGTTGPTSFFGIAGTTAIGSGYASGPPTAPTNGLIVQGNVGLGTSTPGSSVQIGGNAVIGFGTSAVLGPSSGLAVSGNLGVGTTSPNYKLEVVGTSHFTGNSTFDGVLQLADGTNAAPSLTFLNDTNTGLYRIDTDRMSFVTGGASALTINSAGNVGIGNTNPGGSLIVNSGNVGIGTNSPTQLLHVAGSMLLYTGNPSTAVTFLGGADDTNFASNRYVTIDMDNNNDSTDEYIRFTTNGAASEYMRITAAGNVGVGTIAPTSLFAVAGAAAIGSGYAAGSPTAPSNGLIVQGNVGIGTSTPGSALQIVGAGVIGFGGAPFTAPSQGLVVSGNVGVGTSSPVQQFQINPSGSNALVMTSGGNLGIGTTSPQNKLEVIGNTNLIGTLTVSGTTTFDGTQTFNGIVQLADGTNAAPSLTFSNDTNTGLYRIDTDRMSFVTGGASALTINSAGNVGIGTTGPTSLFSVAGTAAIGSGYAAGSPTAPSNGLIVQGNVGIGTSTPGATLQIAGNQVIGFGVAPTVNSATNGLVVGGNVGIGNSNPAARLEITGNFLFTKETARIISVADSTSSNTAGAALNITGAAGSGTAAGGAINITSGAGGSTGLGGNINITVGTTTNAANTATLALKGSTSTDLDTGGGPITITGGDGRRNSTAGAVTITGGTGVQSGGTVGGAVNITGGVGTGTVNGGALVLAGGTSDSSGAGGAISITSGAGGASSGVSGALTLATGTTTSGRTGDLTLRTGAATGGNAGDIFFQTNGTNLRMTVAYGGNVGIGTSTPGATLQVAGNSVIGFGAAPAVSSATQGLVVGGNLGVGTSSPSQTLHVQGTQYVSGNLGVGTSSPGAKLSVAGGGLIGYTGTQVAPSNGLAILGNVGIGTTSPAYNLQVVGTTNITGASTFGGALQLADGTNSAPSLTFANDTNTGLYRIDTDRMSLVTGGASALTINSSGNVGIGNTNPGGSLIVNSGNVGIGTNSPVARLDVRGAVLINQTSLISDKVLDVAGEAQIDNYLHLGTGAEGFGDTQSLLEASHNFSISAGAHSVGIYSFPTRGNGTNAGIFHAAYVASARIDTSDTVSNVLQYWAGNPAVAGGGTITNSYGLYVENMTSGTNDFGVFVVGADTAAGYFGGNVGIGNSSPGASLQIHGNGVIGYGVNSVAGPTNGLAVLGNVGIGTTSPSNELHVIGAGLFQTNLTVGGNTAVSETLANSGFLVNGDDLFVAGSAGIEGNVYTDGSFIAGASTTYGNGSITQTSGETLTIGTTNADLTLQTTTAGDIVFSPSGGNVGVGTAAPTSLFSVAGAAAIGSGYATGSPTAPSNGLIVQGNVGIGTSTPGATLQIAGNQAIGWGGAPVISAPTDGLTVRGNVGIGTSNPGKLLHVAGAARMTGTIASEKLYDPLLDSLVYHLPFSEGTGSIAADRSVSANDGTLTGGTWATSNLGNALDFNGTSDFVESASNAFDVSSTTSWTISAWINPDVITGGGTIVGISTTNADYIYLHRLGDEVGWIVVKAGNNTRRQRTNSDVFAPDNWYYVTMTKTGDSDVKVYVNGVEYTTRASHTDDTQPNVNNKTWIGRVKTVDVSIFFDGTIDEPMVFTRVLSLAEIRELYERGLGTNNIYVNNANGYVGVNTTSPTSLFSVNGAVSIGTYAAGGAIAPTNGLIVSGNVGIGTSVPAQTLHLVGTQYVSGNIGIGTSSPGAKLSVAGGGLFGYTGTEAAPTNGLAVFGNVGIGTTSPAYNLQVVGTANITGTSTFGGALQLADGTNAAPSLTFTNDTNTGLYRIDTDRMSLVTGGASRLAINSAGNVGIGNTNPGGSLIVNSGNVGIGTNSPTAALSFGASPTIDNTSGNITLDPAANLTVNTGVATFTQDATNQNNFVTIDPAARTGMTSGMIDLSVSGNTQTITGSYTLQRFSLFAGSTITAASALTITNAATVAIQGVPASAGSAAITNAYGLLIQNETTSAAGTTNAYGLGVIAPTGATNNYAGYFMGGNVGVGSSFPGAGLQVAGNAVIGFGSATAVTAPTNGLAVGGNVGIGTTSPATKLDVIGDISAGTGTRASAGVLRLPNAAEIRWRNAANNADIRFMTNSSDQMFIDDGTNTRLLVNTTLDSVVVGSGSSAGFNGGLKVVNVQTGLTDNTYGVYSGSTLTTANSSSISVVAGINSAPTITMGSSATVTDLASIYSNAPAITIGSGTITNAYNLYLNGAPTAGTNRYAIFNTSGTVYLGTGNIGIGTSSPGAKLSVAGGGLFGYTGTEAAPTNGLAVLGNVGIGTTSPQYNLHVVGTTNITGASTFGGALQLADGTNAAPSLTFANDTNTGLYRIDSDRMTFVSGGLDRMTLNTSGNVGIGTTGPSALFQVGATPTSPGLAVTSGGNVGIGMSSPSSPLHIVSTLADNSSGSTGVFYNITSSATSNAGNRIGLDLKLSQGAEPFTGAQNLYGARIIQGASRGPIANSYGVYAATTLDTNGSGATNDYAVYATSGGGGTVAYGVYADSTTSQAPLNIGLYGQASNTAGTRDAYAGQLRISGNVTGNARGLLVNNATVNVTGNYYGVYSDLTNATITGAGAAGYFTDGTRTVQLAEKTYAGLFMGGNVGIGTSTPGATLQIAGNSVIGFGAAPAITGPTNGLAVGGNVGIGTTNPTGFLHVGSSVANPSLFVPTSGNVAIRTTNAPSALTLGPIYLADTFNRSNSTNLGNTDTGSAAWTENTGDMEISSNNVVWTSGDPTIATVESNSGDVDITVDLARGGAGTPNILWRFSDTSNYWYINVATNLELHRIVSGSDTTVVTVSGGGLSNSTSGTFRVRHVGSDLRVYKNGVQQTSQSDSSLSINTRHGVRTTGCNTSCTMDNVIISPLSSGIDSGQSLSKLTPGIISSSAGAAYGQHLQVLNSSSSNANTVYGQYISFVDQGILANNNYGLYVDTNTSNTSDNQYAAAFMNGNVGIGTSTPGAALQVAGAGIIGFGVAPSVSVPSNGLAVGGNVGIGNSNPAARLEITGNLLFTKETARTISVQDTTSSNTAGAQLSLTGAAGAGTGAGGALVLTAGASSSTGTAGAVTITGGENTATGAGTFPAGGVTITGGRQGSGTTAATGGDVTITGGRSNGTATGGAVTLTGGAGGDQSPVGGDGGAVTLTGGVSLSSTSGAGGAASLIGGAGVGTSAGGAGILTGGAGGATGAGGAITLTTGAGGSSSGVSGALTLATGTTTSGRTGDLTLRSGAATGGNAGDIFFQTNGANNRMTIAYGGNVGIGTSTPGATLQIAGNSVIGFGAAPAVTAPTNGLAVGGNLGVGNSNPLQRLHVNQSETTSFVVSSAGNVGIGTSTPRALLDVRGAAIFNEDGADADFRIESDTNANAFTLDAGAFSGVGAFGFGTDVAPGGYIMINPTFTAAASNDGFVTRVAGTVTGQPNFNIHGLVLTSTAVEASSGNHTLITSLFVDTPAVTVGDATVSNTASIYIAGAMAATVTGNNYALWADSGLSRFDGNVGIGGATSTYATTQIRGSGTGTALSFLTTDSSGTQRFAILDNGNVGIGTTGPLGLLHVGSSATAPGLVVTSGGNVGIGFSSPQATLDVRGVIFANDGSASAPAYSFSSDTNTGLWRRGGNTIAITTNGVSLAQFDATTLQLGTNIDAGVANVVTNGRTVRAQIEGGAVFISDSAAAGTDGDYVQLAMRAADAAGTRTAIRFQGDGNANLAAITSITQTAGAAGHLIFQTSPSGVGGNLTERIRIQHDGNVGIGTSAPTSLFSVAGTTAIGLGYASGSPTAPSNGLIVQGNVGIGTSTPGATLQIAGNSVVGFGTAPAVTGPTNGLAVGGNVGIGTTSPGALLDVRGAAIFNEDGGDFDFRIESDGNANILTVDAGVNSIGFGAAPNSRYFADFGGAGTHTYTSAATSTNDAAYVLVRPSSVANTSGTGDIYTMRVVGGSLNPTGASTTGAGLALTAPSEGGAGSFTNMANLYLADAPTGGTNNYALWVDAGNVRLDGNNLSVGGDIATNIGIQILSAITASNNDGIGIQINPTITGTGASDYLRGIRGYPNITVPAAGGINVSNIFLDNPGVTFTSTGTLTGTPGFSQLFVTSPTLSHGTAITIANAAGIYVAGAPAGGGAGPVTITNSYALWVDAGTSRFDGETYLAMSSGNVGIGTSTPGATLQIAGNSVIGFGVAPAVTAPTNGLAVGGNIGIGNSNPLQRLHVNQSETTSFVVASSGNVGIGTSTPLNPLEVRSTTTPQLRLAYDPSNYNTYAVSSAGAGTLTTVGTTPAFDISVGRQSDGNGATLTLQTIGATGSNTEGGDILITTGIGSASGGGSNDGDITLRTGPSSGISGGTGGDINLQTSNGISGLRGGDINLTAGTGAGASGGGDVVLTAGASNADTWGGGLLTFISGAGQTTGSGGTIAITGGQGGSTGAGAPITIATGAGGSTSGNSGALTLRTNSVQSGSLAGDISFQTNGSNIRMTVAGGGNVGIGTSTPGATLQVAGNSVIGFGVAPSVTAPSNGLAVGGNVGIGTSNPTSALHVTGNAAIDGGTLSTAATTFNLVNTTATTVNLAGAATAISIGAATGTTTINNQVDIVSGTAIRFLRESDSVLIGSIVNSSSPNSVANIMTLGGAASGGGLADNDGTVMVYANADQLRITTTTAPQLTHETDTDTGVYWAAADNLRLRTGGVDRLTANIAGNVGIGMSNPGAGLQVGGNAVIGYGPSSTAGPSDGLAVFGNLGVGTTSPNYKVDVAGSLNVTGDVYKNGSAYTNPDYALEHWVTGGIVVNADKPGASTYTGILSLEDTEAFVKQNFQLPRVASATGIFERGDILLEKVEEAYIHLFDLNRKIASNSAQLSDLSAALTTQTINLGSFSIASSSAGLAISSSGQNLLALDTLGNMKLAGTITSEAGAFDIAEDYPATDESIEAGDVVAISETLEGNIEKSSTPYQNGIVGVISTKAGLHLGGEDGRPVALAGRVPVKVTTENGPIAAGDSLTSSSIPGLAMKMTRAGTSIGKALESFSCPTSDICQGTVLTFINVGWHDPTVYFTAGGLQQLVSLPLDTEIASQSAIASPSAQNTTYDIPNTNLSEDPLFKDLLSRFDLLSSRLDALQRVVVGTESAELVPASSSAELLAAIEDVQLNASGSAILTGDLTVAGRTTLNDVGITGTLNAGVLTIEGMDSAINTLAGDLKLQNLALGGIDILAGKIKIDTKGNIVSEGTITAKEVEAEKITTQKLVITEPVATQSAVLSASASATASPSAVLSASAGTVTIKAGQTSIDVETSALTVKSLVFVTPDKPIATSGKVKDATTVTISIPTPTPEDIKVNWWIIN